MLTNLILSRIHHLELSFHRFNHTGGLILPDTCLTTQSHDPKLLSIIVPTFNEEKGIREFNRRLVAVLRSLPFSSEIVYVNDGSKDGTLEILHSLSAEHDNLAVIDLSRNFGKEVALTAGLDHACGDAVIIIDADLQDPPELIPDLVRVFKESGA